MQYYSEGELHNGWRFCLNCGMPQSSHISMPNGLACPVVLRNVLPDGVALAEKDGKKMTGAEMLRKFSTGATRNLDENLSWAAGFFDGEGSTSCTKNNGKVDARLQVSVGQKDYRGEVSPALLRFFGAMGCGHIYHKAHYSRDMNQHQFQACSYGDVVECLRKMWPYLSQPKKDQARVAITRYGKARGGETTINGLE